MSPRRPHLAWPGTGRRKAPPSAGAEPDGVWCCAGSVKKQWTNSKQAAGLHGKGGRCRSGALLPTLLSYNPSTFCRNPPPPTPPSLSAPPILVFTAKGIYSPSDTLRQAKTVASTAIWPKKVGWPVAALMHRRPRAPVTRRSSAET